MKSLILVGIGGAIGSILRYTTVNSINRIFNATFPLGTFIVNLIGCLIIGIIIAAAEKEQLINNEIKLLLVAGFCGGFTTFSSFSLENIQLLNLSNFSALALNIFGSVLLGVFGVWLGLNIIK